MGRLGYAVIHANWDQSRIEIGLNKSGRIVPAREADLFVANSGTSMRFLTALVALGEGRYRLDGIARMRERPIQDLLTALSSLGVRAQCEHSDGCPPVVLDANGMDGGSVIVRGDVSSQFLSGLLLASLHGMRQPVRARRLRPARLHSLREHDSGHAAAMGASTPKRPGSTRAPTWHRRSALPTGRARGRLSRRVYLTPRLPAISWRRQRLRAEKWA